MKISVAMTCYNCEPFLYVALGSIIKQSYEDWEIIFIDDHSTDGSLAVAAEFRKHFPEKMKVIGRMKNGGYGAALKDAFDYSNGKLVAIVDADDAITPYAFEKMVEAHKRYPEAAVVYSKSYWCNSNLTPYKEGPSSPIPEGKSLLWCLDGGSKTGRVSHLKVIKRKFYDLTDGVNPTLRKRVDKDLALKLEEVGDLVFIPDILYRYRDHKDNLTNLYHRMTKEEQEKILKKSRQTIEDAKIRRRNGKEIQR